MLYAYSAPTALISARTRAGTRKSGAPAAIRRAWGRINTRVLVVRACALAVASKIAGVIVIRRLIKLHTDPRKAAKPNLFKQKFSTEQLIF